MTQPLDQRLKAYQRRVNELQGMISMPLSSGRLRDIAAEFDLSGEDLAAADDIAYASFQTGEAMLAQGDYDKALDAFADAVALRPDWLQYRAALASAYLYRYEVYGRDHDRYRVIELTQDCLEVEAGYRPAVELINRLNARQAQQGAEQVDLSAAPEQEPPPLTPPPEAVQSGKSPLGCLLMLGIGMMFSFCCCFSSDSSDEYEVAVDVDEPEVVEPALDPELSEMLETMASAKQVDVVFLGAIPGPLDAAGRVEKGNYDLRVMRARNPESESIGVEVVRSRLKVYGPDNAYYETWIQLRNDSDLEVTKLPLKVTVFDHDGAAIASKDLNALNSFFSSAMRPGDVTGQRRLIKTTARAASMSFEVGDPTFEQAPPSYPASTPAPVTWAGSVGASSDLIDVKIRSQSYKDNSLEKGKGFFKVEFEVTNRSDQPILKLQSKLHSLDASGEVVDSQDWYMIGSLFMPIVGGQTRIIRRTFGVPATYASFELEVLNLELDASE